MDREGDRVVELWSSRSILQLLDTTTATGANKKSLTRHTDATYFTRVRSSLT
jgi:hypothetical protein